VGRVCVGATKIGGVVCVAGLSGDTGDIGLVGLLIDFLQVSDVVTQGCHTGLPYGSGHIEKRVWVVLPVNPVGQASVWVSVVTWHVGGFCVQVLLLTCQSDHVSLGQLFVRVSVMLPLWLMGQLCVRTSVSLWQVVVQVVSYLQLFSEFPVQTRIVLQVV